MTASAPYDLAGKRVWVAGHRGMVGGAIARRLVSEGCEVLTASREELDLTDQRAVLGWMHNHRPQAVFLAAARVGGILANDTRPVEFLRDNLLIETSIFTGAESVGVEKLLFLGSSCIYPKHAAQPMTESALLTGVLEPTNEPYAIAKIAGVKLCESYNPAPRTTRSSRRGACTTRLDTRPARTPVNASSTPSRACTHESGPP